MCCLWALLAQKIDPEPARGPKVGKDSTRRSNPGKFEFFLGFTFFMHFREKVFNKNVRNYKFYSNFLHSFIFFSIIDIIEKNQKKPLFLNHNALWMSGDSLRWICLNYRRISAFLYILLRFLWFSKQNQIIYKYFLTFYGRFHVFCKFYLSPIAYYNF